MKYLIRAAKYFIYLGAVLSLTILILNAAHIVEGDINTIFKNGYDSLWQIALIMIGFSLVYPKLGYSTRSVVLPGSDEEIRPLVEQAMEEHGYKLESENGSTITYIKRSPAARLLKMYEDRLTFTRTINGYDIEGLTKDIVRISSYLCRI